VTVSSVLPLFRTVIRKVAFEPSAYRSASLVTAKVMSSLWNSPSPGENAPSAMWSAPSTRWISP
jgi:hypothetical protein